MTWKYLVSNAILKVPFDDKDEKSKKIAYKQLQDAINGLAAFIDRVDGPRIMDTDQLRGPATPPNPQDNPTCTRCG